MSLPTISVSGKQFVYGANATRFMVRGVAMSATSVKDKALNPSLVIKDILSDEHADFVSSQIIPQLTALNANCIRVYQVDPNNSHSISMKNLEAAGIYVMVGLATSYNSVNQATGAYTQSTFVHAARIVDEFQAYNNTFCFSVGNEVEFPGQMASNIYTAGQSNKPAMTAAEAVSATIALQYQVAAAMKSFARDIKAHITANSYRTIPVGCAMQDGPQASWGSSNPNAYQQGIIGTDIIAQFYAAGDASEHMDFIGINSYRYKVGNPTPSTAYAGLVTEAANLPVPVFLSETGALSTNVPPTPRDWADVPTLYDTTDEYYLQLSGQVAFQMMEEGAGYGLYSVSADGVLSSQYPTSTTDLAAQFLAASTDTLYAAAAPARGSNVAPTSVTPPGLKPISLTWPSLLTPYSYTVPNATITILNVAQYPVLVLQQGGVIAEIAAATSSSVPVSASVNVLSGTALTLLGNKGTVTSPDWVALCGVAGADVVNGITFSTAVSWGVDSVCPIYVAITVENYSDTSAVNVVQNGNVMGTVDVAQSADNPTIAKIYVLPSVQILLQGPAPDYISCCMVAAASVIAGITVTNNRLSWGQGACIVS